MSYHLYIKRSGQKPDQGSEISLEDWLAIIETDEEFSCIVNEGDIASAIYQGADSLEHMTWLDGNVNVDTPSEKLLDKMLTLANTLDAQVVGATGEPYPESNQRYLNGAMLVN